MTTTHPSPPSAMTSRGSRPTRRVAGVLAAGFLVVASFQAALALGAPLGRAAFGGAHAGTLPLEFRVASAVAAGFWALAALHALSRGGVTRRFPRLAYWRATWLLAGLTAVGALMNAASSSPWERFGWAPFTLGLSILCVLLARSGREGQSSREARQSMRPIGSRFSAWKTSSVRPRAQ